VRAVAADTASIMERMMARGTAMDMARGTGTTEALATVPFVNTAARNRLD